ncbi:MAG TPA: hypothetical protein VKU19_30175 [Bryobacteraceae bacterium]|nr:hypothetical protein [Bryobacteraceae bacterium]
MNLTCAVLSKAQQTSGEPPDPTRVETGHSIHFGKGPARGTIVLDVTEPIEAGDVISGVVSTDKLIIAMTLPDGQTIRKETAHSAGFDWSESPMEAPIGSTDGGHLVTIYFSKPLPSGHYVLEFTAKSLNASADARFVFISPTNRYWAEMRSLPQVQFPDPVKLTQSSLVSLELAEDEHGALMDIVVPDRTVKGSITMPDGRTLQAGVAAAGIEWKTVDDPVKIDPPGAWFGISGFLMPVKGIHHVIGGETLPKGRYEIRAVAGGEVHGEMRVAFIPISRLFEMASKQDHNPAIAPDDVHIQPVGTVYSCFAGDALDLQFVMVGDVRSAIDFSLKIEHTEQLPWNGSGPVQWGPPHVNAVAVKFTRAADGKYYGKVVLGKPGLVRILLRASGKKASGARFAEEVVFPQVNVAPLVARLSKVSAAAVDTNGDHKLDRLDVICQLDVVMPGEYDFSALVRDTASGGVYANARATLKAGPQRLVASLDAKEMRKLKDGPYEIQEVRIYRSRNTNYGDYVGVGVQPVRTALYKREDWDPGPLFGAESVSVRGIRPAPSARFQFAEVEWGVTTPGGNCYWDGSLVPQRKGDAHVQGSGKLPAGRSDLSFVFPAAVIAAADTTDWTFWGMVACDNSEAATSPFLKLKIDRKRLSNRTLFMRRHQ